MRLAAVRNSLAIFVLAMGALVFSAVRAEPIPITLQVRDGPGEGFNDPVLGPARLTAMQYAADLWGSFFEKSFPTQVVDVAIAFDPFPSSDRFVAISTFPTGRPRTSSNFRTTLTHAEQLVGRLNGNLINGFLQFDSNEDWFYGTSGDPGNRLDFVTMALHEFSHVFGFYTALRADGTYTNSNNLPSFYDFSVCDRQGNQLLQLSPEERISDATTLGGLTWCGDNGVAANGGIPPILAAGANFDPRRQVIHLSETLGPDVLLDPAKDLGEVIHSLSAVERGMFEDLLYTMAPLQTVPEPAEDLLLLAGLLAIVYSRGQRTSRVRK